MLDHPALAGIDEFKRPAMELRPLASQADHLGSSLLIVGEDLRIVEALDFDPR